MTEKKITYSGIFLINLFLSFPFLLFLQFLVYVIMVLNKCLLLSKLQTEFVDLLQELPKPRRQLVILNALK